MCVRAFAHNCPCEEVFSHRGISSHHLWLEVTYNLQMVGCLKMRFKLCKDLSRWWIVWYADIYLLKVYSQNEIQVFKGESARNIKRCQRADLLDVGFGPQTIYPRWVINTRAQPEPLLPRTIFAIATCMGKHSSASTSAYAGDQPSLH